MAKGTLNKFVIARHYNEVSLPINQWEIMPNSKMNGKSWGINTLQKNNEKVTKNAPSKWCWFDHIYQILTKINHLSKGKDMGTPKCNPYQGVKDVDHNTKPKCKDYHH